MFEFAHFVEMIPDILKAFKETLIMISIYCDWLLQYFRFKP